MTRARNNANLTGRPLFSVYAATTQALAANTNVKIAHDTKEFDTHTGFDTALGRYTAKVPGYYRFSGAVIAGATSLTEIWKNGVQAKRGTQGSATSHVVTALIYMNGTTDYVEHYVHCPSATNLASVGAAVGTYFQGEFVRAA